MPEVWLRTNRRALSMGLALPGIVGVVAAVGLAWSILTRQHWAIGGGLAILAGNGGLDDGGDLDAMTQPRVAYDARDLLVYLEPTRPTRVPVEIVECFFWAKGRASCPSCAERAGKRRM